MCAVLHEIDDEVQAIDRDGFVIIPDVLSPDEVALLRDELLRCISESRSSGGTGSVAGKLLERGEVFEAAVCHPLVTAVVRHLLGDGFLVSQVVGSRRPRGAPRLRLHSDCTYMPDPFPIQPQVATALWVCDEFSERAGCTRIVPASHREGRHPDAGEGDASAVPMTCGPGSVVVWNGATWHGNYARRIDGDRVCLHVTYNRMILRPFEHYDLPAEALERRPELAAMLGQYDPFGKSTHTGPDYRLLIGSARAFEASRARSTDAPPRLHDGDRRATPR